MAEESPLPDRAAAAPGGRTGTRIDAMIERRGLRPRFAASLVIATWVVAVLVFGIVQRLADPTTFPTIWTAWWWAVQTVTTVGYGDIVPEQAAGKAVASILMIGGLAFLSILTATITSSFVARRQARSRALGEDPALRVLQELRSIDERLEAIQAELRRGQGA